MTLLDKLKQATGADRELDAQVWAQLSPKSYVSEKNGLLSNDMSRAMSWEAQVRAADSILAKQSPRLTSSVDACLALMGEVLPDWWVSLSTNGPTSAMIGEEGRGFAKYEDHPVLPIALLIAIMRAVSEWS